MGGFGGPTAGLGVDFAPNFRVQAPSKIGRMGKGGGKMAPPAIGAGSGPPLNSPSGDDQSGAQSTPTTQNVTGLGDSSAQPASADPSSQPMPAQDTYRNLLNSPPQRRGGLRGGLGYALEAIGGVTNMPVLGQVGQNVGYKAGYIGGPANPMQYQMALQRAQLASQMENQQQQQQWQRGMQAAQFASADEARKANEMVRQQMVWDRGQAIADAKAKTTAVELDKAKEQWNKTIPAPVVGQYVSPTATSVPISQSLSQTPPTAGGAGAQQSTPMPQPQQTQPTVASASAAQPGPAPDPGTGRMRPVQAEVPANIGQSLPVQSPYTGEVQKRIDLSPYGKEYMTEAAKAQAQQDVGKPPTGTKVPLSDPEITARNAALNDRYQNEFGKPAPTQYQLQTGATIDDANRADTDLNSLISQKGNKENRASEASVRALQSQKTQQEINDWKTSHDPAAIGRLADQVQSDPMSYFSPEMADKAVRPLVDAELGRRGTTPPSRKLSGELERSSQLSELALTRVQNVKQQLQDPEIQSLIGPLMGRLSKGEQAVGMDIGASTEKQQRFLSDVNYLFFGEGRAMLGGRPVQQLMKDLERTSPRPEQSPRRFAGALQAVEETARGNIETGKNYMYGGTAAGRSTQTPPPTARGTGQGLPSVPPPGMPPRQPATPPPTARTAAPAAAPPAGGTPGDPLGVRSLIRQ